MRARRLLASVGVLSLLAAASLLVPLGEPLSSQAAGVSSNAPRYPELEVAIAGSRKCGPFAPALAGIVAVQGARPQDQSPPVRVCLRSKVGGRISLAIGQLADQEAACTGSESAVDTTCGAGAGELSGSLVQVLSVESTCFRPAGATELPLRSLVDHPADLFWLGTKEACVVLFTRYAPPTPTHAQAAQSDVVRWIYVFRLTTS